MDFLCPTDSLLTAISSAQRIVNTQTSLDYLNGILFEVDKEEQSIKLTAFDMNTGIEILITNCEVYAAGSVNINAKMLRDIVAKLPDETVRMTLTDNNAVDIISGNSSFRLIALSADNYPKLPTEGLEASLVVEQATLRKLIHQTIFAVSKDKARPAFNGILFTVKDNVLELVALDGFRLAIARKTYDYDLKDVEFLIPGDALRELQQLLALDEDKVVEIFASENNIQFDLGNTKLITRLINQEFMNYQGIIPSEYNTQIHVNTTEMRQAVERATVIVPTNNRRMPMTLRIEDFKTLQVECQTQVGFLHDELAVEMEGEDLDIDFNPHFFLDALRVIEEENIFIGFTGAVGPCVIKPIDSDEFSYIVLPLRR